MCLNHTQPVECRCCSLATWATAAASSTTWWGHAQSLATRGQLSPLAGSSWVTIKEQQVACLPGVPDATSHSITSSSGRIGAQHQNSCKPCCQRAATAAAQKPRGSTRPTWPTWRCHRRKPCGWASAAAARRAPPGTGTGCEAAAFRLWEAEAGPGRCRDHTRTPLPQSTSPGTGRRGPSWPGCSDHSPSAMGGPITTASAAICHRLGPITGRHPSQLSCSGAREGGRKGAIGQLGTPPPGRRGGGGGNGVTVVSSLPPGFSFLPHLE